MDMEVANEDEAPTGNEATPLHEGLVIFAREVVLMTWNGTLCQRYVQQLAEQCSVVEISDEDGTVAQWTPVFDGLFAEMFGEPETSEDSPAETEQAEV